MTFKQCKTTVLIGLFLALFGCSEKQSSKDTLHFVISDDVKTLDPVNAYDEISLTILPNIVEPLYDYDYTSDEYKIAPALAATMPKVFDQGLRVVVPLRKGIYFAKPFSREVKAKDFLLAIHRLADPRAQSTGAWVFEERLVGFTELQKKWREEFKNLSREAANEKVIGAQIEGVRALDDYTLEFKLLKPYPQLIYAFTLAFTSPVNDEFYRKYSDETGQMARDVLGTGPYKLEKLERGNKVVLVKNESYRQDPVPAQFSEDAGRMMPLVPRVEFHVIRESQPAWLRFQQGQIDVMKLALSQVSDALESGMTLKKEFQDKGVVLSKSPAPTAFWVSFNFKEKIFKNKLLRQAMSSALDRQQWMKIFYKGYASQQIRSNPLQLKDSSEIKKLKYDYDLEVAKKLLVQAGYPGGKGLPEFNLELRGSGAIERQMGEFLKAQYEKVGIRVNPILNSFPAFLEKQKNMAWQMMLGGWYLDYPDVENMYQLFYSKNAPPGSNANSYSNGEFDKIFNTFLLKNAGDVGRRELVESLESLLQEDVPWAYGVIPDYLYLSQGRVKNFIPREFGKNTLKYIGIKN